jgi:hypothetical protein
VGLPGDDFDWKQHSFHRFLCEISVKDGDRQCGESLGKVLLECWREV